MSYFICHHPCPRCGSSDAFAEYDDGHYFCFSCRKYVPAKTTSLKQVENAFKDPPKQKFDFPHDYTQELPKEPYAWLKSYALTNEEIKQNGLGWSESKQMLIYPYYGEKDELLCWQGRFFPQRKPKTITYGYPDSHLLCCHNDNSEFQGSVVVVEDPVSAIKVARVCTSTVLLGSNLSMHKALRLSRGFSKVFLWLDNDKVKEMIKFKQKYASLFDTVSMVVSEQDPKCYNEHQIKESLNAR